MKIVLECSKIIQYDIDSIKKSQFNSICIDNDTYTKIDKAGIKIAAVKLNISEIDIDSLKCNYLIVELGKWSYKGK